MNSANETEKPSILVTGAAGFVGFHLTRRLLDTGHRVIGIDNLNDYYDPSLKQARLALLETDERFVFRRVDLADHAALTRVFDEVNPAVVVHLAAQAGVRYSLENPGAYVHSNLVGFANVLEACRYGQVRHLLYAWSSPSTAETRRFRSPRTTRSSIPCPSTRRPSAPTS